MEGRPSATPAASLVVGAAPAVLPGPNLQLRARPAPLLPAFQPAGLDHGLLLPHLPMAAFCLAGARLGLRLEGVRREGSADVPGVPGAQPRGSVGLIPQMSLPSLSKLGSSTLTLLCFQILLGPALLPGTRCVPRLPVPTALPPKTYRLCAWLLPLFSFHLPFTI